MLKQITVFLENKSGRMEDVTGCLSEESINLHALSVADTTDFGILRLIVSDPEKAFKSLKSKGFMVKTADVIAVAIDNSPGSLHKVLRELNSPDTSIEYMYAFTNRHKDYDAIVILSVGNQVAVTQKLKNAGFSVLDENLLGQMSQ